jgi:hypothetical protein
MKRMTMRGMKWTLGVFALMLMALMIYAWPQPEAATSNPSSGSSGYQILVTHIPGAHTSTVTPVKFKAPWPYRVLSISAYARVVKTGSTETYTLDVQQGTTSLLSTPMSLATQATVLDGTLATTPNIADEATVSYILTLGGDTPSITDTTVVMAVKRQ